MRDKSSPHRRAKGLLVALDYFVPSQYAKNAYIHTRVRVLIGINLVLGLAFLAAHVHLGYSQALGESSNVFQFAVLLPGLLVNIALPWVIRRTGQLVYCQHLTLLSLLAASLTGIYLTGGPVVASGSQTPLVICVLAFFLTGIRGGLLWSGLLLVSTLAMYLLHFRGFQYPNLQSPAVVEIGEVFNFLLCLASLVICIFLIELNRERLEQAIKQKQARLTFLANHDPLTGLANRLLFDRRLRAVIRNPVQEGKICVMFYIDLNGFKKINDEHGHAVGDEVLQVIAARLQMLAQRLDTVARLGGDEFALLLQLDATAVLEEKLAAMGAQLAQPIELASGSFTVSSTIGASIKNEHSTEASLWNASDRAMYQARHEGVKWVIARE